LLQLFFENGSARAQFIVGKLLYSRLKSIDFFDNRLNGFQITLIAATKNFC